MRETIYHSVFHSVVVFAILICSIEAAYEVAIYGATPGGIAAAITAARASPSFSVVIIEPTSYIGGMAAAGGIGLRDLGLEVTSECTVKFFLYFSVLHLIDCSKRFGCTAMGQ